MEKVESERVMSRDKADRMMSKRKERERVCVRERKCQLNEFSNTERP